MNPDCQKFLNAFLTSLPSSKREDYESRRVSADFFCADEGNANLCALLVRKGEKRATCGLAHWYDSGEETLPQVGDLLIVLDWQQNPMAIVEQVKIERKAFQEIGADFAAMEGEGDKSYVWWRKTHWDFFSRELSELGREMHDDIEIVTEEFRLVWPSQ